MIDKLVMIIMCFAIAFSIALIIWIVYLKKENAEFNERIKRKYTCTITNHSVWYSIEEWNLYSRGGSFNPHEGIGYYTKDGMMCRDIAGISEVGDADGVAWYFMPSNKCDT